MIGVDHTTGIRGLTRQGHSTRAIVRITGLSPNTVRYVLRDDHDLVREDTARPFELDPCKD